MKASLDEALMELNASEGGMKEEAEVGEEGFDELLVLVLLFVVVTTGRSKFLSEGGVAVCECEDCVCECELTVRI